MSGKVFADTNILLYLLSEQDPRNARATAIFASRPTISTQVVNEFAVNCLRKAGKTREETAALAVALLDCCDVQPVAESTVRLGLTLSTRYQLSIWDAMILAAALEANCETLYSEDMQHRQVIEERLSVINPFVS